MLTWILLTLFLGLIFWGTRKPSGLPPGRWGLPLIGYLPLYSQNISEILANFRKEYGDIFTWKAGGLTMVGLCDYKMIKSTFSRPECQGRPDLFTFDALKFNQNVGLLMSVGDAWQEGRRFALRHLKDLGMGKSSMEEVVLYEAIALTKSYESTAGTPVELSWNLNVAVLNVIWKLVADIRYETDDEEIIRFNKMVTANFEVIQGPAGFLDIFPGLHKILPNFILNGWMKVNLLYNSMDTFKEYVTPVIEEHKKTFNPDYPRDYIDAYLAQIQKQDANSDGIFKEDYTNLVVTIADLFGAGSETTASTMRWIVAFMALNPYVQDKLQKEIDQVIPRDGVPSYQDREKLSYVEAVLLEVHRHASLLPIGVFHRNTEAIEVGDYRLPKNTIMFAYAEACHKDPKYWERPDEFYPEHFLDDQGRLLTKKEGFLPFSYGRRQCMGEALAKMEFFLFATCFFQKFSVAPPEGVTISAETDRTQALLNTIKPYKVVMTKRE